MESGTRLGPYEIQELLGAGGMGEVYLAQDTRLGRKVAIKVLPEGYASDPERLARFEQEARAAAALNHPNIASVFDVGHENGTHFIVQEYLEGRSLRDLLRDAPPKLERSLAIGADIAAALAVAHRDGIVHRDIKPDNVFVTADGHTKVLDFGLAKLVEPAGRAAAPDASLSPTAIGTIAGTVMGTAGYMAPEQVEGGEIDGRTDVFALGCVLYEMTTGRRPFEGDNIHTILGRIVSDEPRPVRLARPGLPDRLGWIVEKCLAKDPGCRYQTAADLAVDLGAVDSSASAGSLTDGSEAGVHEDSSRRVSPAVALGAALALVLGSSWLTSWLVSPEPPPAPVLRTTSLLPEGWSTREESRVLAISPDGSTLVFSAGMRMWARNLATGVTTEIRTSGEDPVPGILPFFSPDGERIAYAAGTTLVTHPLAAGGAIELVSLMQSVWGASWGPDGNIYYGLGEEGIWRVPEDGGEPSLVRGVEADEVAHGPQLLPGGEWVLFTLRHGTDPWSDSDIVAYNQTTEESRLLLSGGTDATFIPTGHLLYARDKALLAVPLDLTEMRIEDVPREVVEGIGLASDGATGSAQYSVSETGTLAYVAPPPPLMRRLRWVDRDGTPGDPLGPPFDRAELPRLSPDGRRAVFTSQGRLLVHDVGTDGHQELPLSGLPASVGAIWTPDGREIVYESVDGHLYRVASDGSSRPRPLGRVEGHRHPQSWTAAGDLVFVEVGPTASIWSLGLDEDAEPTPILDRDFFDGIGGIAISPDGEWMAFTSQAEATTTAVADVWVSRLPAGPRVRVSSGGATSPKWSPDGRELYFSDGDATRIGGGENLYVVSFTDGDRARPEPARRLFAAEDMILDFDVAADGRFLMVERETGPPPARHINLIVNWFTELERLVPTGR